MGPDLLIFILEVYCSRLNNKHNRDCKGGYKVSQSHYYVGGDGQQNYVKRLEQFLQVMIFKNWLCKICPWLAGNLVANQDFTHFCGLYLKLLL